MIAQRKNRHIWRIYLLLVLLLFTAGVVSIGSVRGQEDAEGPLEQRIAQNSFTADPPQPFKTAPPDLPRFEVTGGHAQTGEGYVFLSPFSFGQVGRDAAYLLILDNDGEPVYYHRFERLPNAMDFKRHDNGLLTYYNRITGEFIALNNRYEVVDAFGAGNGYKADLHDFQLMDNGHYLIMIYDMQIVDMSQIYPGGNPAAKVIGCIIQELDAARNVVFQWRSWDHIDILDGDVDFTAEYVNYMNCNALERDLDGNLLLSSRNMDEITKINRQTGAVMWRMGGKKNEFTFTNDNGFSKQHDVRRQADGLITLFDNGVNNAPAVSRGLEMAVDEINKTVTVIREFRNTPDVSSVAMGNMQRLPNGNSAIGWGASFQPVYTEFDDLGQKVLEFNALENVASYRAFRFPWQGFPTWPPALVAQTSGQDVNLYFSWNGATETHGYMIFAQGENGGETHLANVTKDGFENMYTYTPPTAGIWKFRVVAIDEAFKPLESSPVVTLFVGGHSTYLPLAVAQVKS